MTNMGVDSDYFVIDLSIARGLDYYTGTVYETILDNYPKLGSVCSGGRFDNLASYYTKEKLPGVGISIGLTRLFYQLRQIGIIPCTKKTIADVIIVPMDNSNINVSLHTAQLLRTNGFKVDVLLEEMSIKKKFQYVNKKDAAFTIVVGTDEELSGKLTVQFKVSNEIKKQQISLSSLPDFLNSHFEERIAR